MDYNLQFTVCKTSLSFETYGHVQIKTTFKTLKVYSKKRNVVGRHFSTKYLNAKSFGEWNLIRQVVFNTDNSCLEGLEAVSSR